MKDIFNQNSKDFSTFAKNETEATDQYFLKYYNLIANIPKDIENFVKKNCKADSINSIDVDQIVQKCQCKGL